MTTTEEVVKYIQEYYPRPKLDQAWAEACVEFLLGNLSLDPVAQLQDLAGYALDQMLQSNLADSMQRGTGFPENIRSIKDGFIATEETGGPLLVQVTAITDVGTSAFTLMNVRQARLDKADMAGLTKDRDLDVDMETVENQERTVEEEEDTTMPPYPRSMLSLWLDDGTMRVKAMELKRIPDLVLGETFLGCKIVLYKARVRKGIIMLTPETAQVMGQKNAELQAEADRLFLKSLRRRMGKPDDNLEDDVLPQPQQQEQLPAAPPNPPPSVSQKSPIIQEKQNSPHIGPLSPIFKSPSSQTASSIHKPQLPSTTPLPAPTEDFNDSFSIDDEMDETLLREIDAAEKRALEGARSTTSAKTQLSQTIRADPSSRLWHGTNSSQSIPKINDVEIIELHDSGSESDGQTVRKPPTRRDAKPVETIELSD